MPNDAQLPAETGAENKADVERKRSQVAIAGKGFGGMLVPQSLQEMVTFADVMARANIALPKHLRGDPGACLAVCMQALRWEMDPFAVANKSYSVNDRLAYEAQLIAAVVNTRAPIVGRPRYNFSGEGADRQCEVLIYLEGEAEPFDYKTPKLGTIPVKNSPLWKADPDQQLGYYAIRAWARRHTPEILLGVYTREELEAEEPRNVTPPGAGSGLKDRLKGSASGEGFNAVDDFIDAEVTAVDPEPSSFAEKVDEAEAVVETVAEEADAKDAAEEAERPTSPGDDTATDDAPNAAEEPDTPASATDALTDTPAETSSLGEPEQPSDAGEATTPETSSEGEAASPAEGFDSENVLDWAAAVYRATHDRKLSVDEMREVWAKRKDELKRRSPDMFRQVNRACADYAVNAASEKVAGGK
jgi:hypothetical protein